jgi:hypothetical protein
MSMAKKAKKSAKKAKASRGNSRGVVSDVERAAAIVAHVLTHFGGGYAAQRQTETPGAQPANLQIYQKPSDLKIFHSALLESTVRNLAKIDFDINQAQRDQICQAAFQHGVLARQMVVAQATVTLTIVQILTTLKSVQQALLCGGPGGAGGGPVCDF